MQNLSAESLLHLWIPNMFEFKGGIQVYSAFLLKAIQIILSQSRFEIFLKHDRLYSSTFTTLEKTKFHCLGKVPPKLRTAAFAAELAAYALVQKPSLILSTHLNFIPVAHQVNRLTRVPYWAVAHGVDAWNIQNPTLQKALQSADRILAVSNYTRDRLLKEQNLDPEKVSILPNTFDADRFQVAAKPQKLLQRYHLTPDQPVILTIARLDSAERYKGYDQILRTLPEIRRHIPNVHYVLGGKGSDRPRIEQLIRDLDLQDCVTLTGFILDEELCDHYNLCDVFAMPSKGEGFGIVYLEALACGKPTIGGNQDGAIDALCQGKLGVLADPDDVKTLAYTLIQILQRSYLHPYLYHPEVLRQKVIETFGFQQFQETLAELLLKN